MTRISVLVTGPDSSGEGAPPADIPTTESALEYCRSQLASGNELHRVFFYNDGVFACATGDPRAADWAALSANHSIELTVCVAAAQRRGLKEADIIDTANVTGIGQLIEAALVSDRTVSLSA